MGIFDFFEANRIDLQKVSGTKLKMKNGKELLLVDSLIYPLCITHTNGEIIFIATKKFNNFYPTMHGRVFRLSLCIKDSSDIDDLRCKLADFR